VALRDLTDPAAIRRAMHEFDELGRAAFLEHYGFRRSTRYLVVADGREYDSKALVAAAHGFQRPELGPLASADFSGGDQTLSKLRELGFDVRQIDAASGPLGPLLAQFLSAYAAAKTEPFGGGHEAGDVLKRAAATIKETLPPALADARVRPSVGQGDWAAVPWIAVLDPRVTTSTQKGVYPLVLVREDLSGLYVTIAQGVTELKREAGQRLAREAMRDRAAELEPHLGSLRAAGFEFGPGVDLSGSPLGRDYAASVVAWKFFSVGELEESSVDEDVAAVNEAYATLVESGLASSPDHREADGPRVLGVYVGGRAQSNFESGGRRGWWGWKSAPADEIGQIRVGDLVLFASGYTGGSPRVDRAIWETQSVRHLVIGRVDRVPFRTDEAIMPDELSGEAEYPYKFRFTILGEEDGVSLEAGRQLSSDVANALRISAIAQGKGGVADATGSPLLDRYLEVTPSQVGPTTPAELRAIVDDFAERVDASGLRVDSGQLAAFVAGVLTKPFAILTGQSGSGKTQLASKLGEWCGEDARGRPRMLVVPVRPDWTGPEFLFGYQDGLAERVDGRAVWAVPETLEFILRAHRDPGAPYVLILDEMNLAHVERYFADFLSGIESRAPIVPSLVRQQDVWVEDEEGRGLPLPRNLVVVGTVNVDETTYMFSPKVLDRAFVHEFRVSADELDPALRRPTPVERGEELDHQRFVRVLQDDAWQFDHPHSDQQALVEQLRALHVQLSKIGADFGHRVFFEAVRFAALVQAVGGMNLEETLDLTVMTKVLPKIHGSRQRLEDTLAVVHAWAEGNLPETPRLPRTASKLDRMRAILVDAQFVTFTE
jgi:hypothetical protein